jgi:hypothetical protein
MTFSLNEVHAFEALETAIGKLDMDVMDVLPHMAESYAKNARSYAANALYYFSAHELAASPDLRERQEVILNERRLAERERAKAQAIEKRESHVMSLLSGLMPKAAKIPQTFVTLETDAGIFSLDMAYGGSTVLLLEYDRDTFQLSSELDGKELDTEDWSALSGNSTPMVQSPAYAAVVGYLEDLIAANG